MGGYGLRLSVDEMGRFGQMILDGGVYNGKQIVPGDYVKKLWNAHIAIPNAFPTMKIPTDEDLFYSHSYLYHPNADTLMMSGYLGQYVLINRKKNAVVSVLSYTDEDMLRNIWTDIMDTL